MRDNNTASLSKALTVFWKRSSKTKMDFMESIEGSYDLRTENTSLGKGYYCCIIRNGSVVECYSYGTEDKWFCKN